jgi:hypothetical protein
LDWRCKRLERPLEEGIEQVVFARHDVFDIDTVARVGNLTEQNLDDIRVTIALFEYVG